MGVDAQHRQLVTWSDARVLELTGARVPIVQAPMAGAGGVDMAVGAIAAGAIGSLPCAMLSAGQVAAQVAQVRSRANGPLNLNFFCHALDPAPDDSRWRAALAPFYAEFRIDDPGSPPPLRRPFDADMAAMVEEVRPDLVSFHFGLPDQALLDRVRASDALIVGNATTVAEALVLQRRECDLIIAQGFEAGGHAGWFLDGHRPQGLLALLRGIAPATTVPVIAAGGIGDGVAMAAALTAGAGAVQIGTAYLASPESLISAEHRALFGTADTIFTDLYTGRMARGFPGRLTDALGAASDIAPPFPHAATALAPLRARDDAGFGAHWAGQHAAPPLNASVREITERITASALRVLGENHVSA